MDSDAKQKLQETLLDHGRFVELLDYFIDSAAQELRNQERPSERTAPKYPEYFKLAMQVMARESALATETVAASPIEKIFLRSLVLSFVKNDDLGLVVHQTRSDTQAELSAFRRDLGQWREFFEWFQTNRPTATVEEFLDRELARGKMTQEERATLSRWTFLYGYISREAAFHMSIQPPFPDIKVNGRAIRPDIYFWVPASPQINIIVECDGYEFHSSRESFKADRQRDRVLKERGYEVLRFSGSEIFSDPVQAPYQLAQFLWGQRGKS